VNTGEAPTRDVVVIGASYGGVEALRKLAAELPADLPATVLVVQHTSEESPAVLADLLGARGGLRAVKARDGMPLERGMIVVAPPGRHMLLTEEGIRVVFGPRENRTRPAIDPLFRTAAVHYNTRAIGVVLTGLLGDGAVGLFAIARCGGVAVVQDPAEAVAADMPRRALELVPNARKLPLGELAAVISELTRQPAPPPPPIPEALRIEVSITERIMNTQEPAELLGKPSDFTCPECRGTIRVVDDDGMQRFRCRVGHAYSADAFVAAKEQSLEESLWVALQTLQERGQMLTQLAREERARERHDTADSFDTRAREVHRHARRLLELLQELAEPTARSP